MIVTNGHAFAILIVCPVAHGLHALGFARLVYLGTLHFSFHLHPEEFIALPFELGYTLLWLGAQSITIPVPMVGPAMAIVCMLPRPVVVGTATVHVRSLHTLPWNAPMPGVVRMREVPVLPSHLTHAVKVVGMITDWP
jgi:hypothetical protein